MFSQNFHPQKYPPASQTKIYKKIFKHLGYLNFSTTRTPKWASCLFGEKHSHTHFYASYINTYLSRLASQWVAQVWKLEIYSSV